MHRYGVRHSILPPPVRKLYTSTLIALQQFQGLFHRFCYRLTAKLKTRNEGTFHKFFGINPHQHLSRISFSCFILLFRFLYLPTSLFNISFGEIFHKQYISLNISAIPCSIINSLASAAESASSRILYDCDILLFSQCVTSPATRSR